MAQKFKLKNRGDDWLRRRQGLALPALPPTTNEARKYFFTQIRKYAEDASTNGRQSINFEAFAQEWNRTADGKERFYVTIEVLSGYAKAWEKASNIRATEGVMSEQLQELHDSADIFAASDNPFPIFLTSTAHHDEPSQGMVDLQGAGGGHTQVPVSLAADLARSQPIRPFSANSNWSRRRRIDVAPAVAQNNTSFLPGPSSANSSPPQAAPLQPPPAPHFQSAPPPLDRGDRLALPIPLDRSLTEPVGLHPSQTSTNDPQSSSTTMPQARERLQYVLLLFCTSTFDGLYYFNTLHVDLFRTWMHLGL